MSVVFPTIPDIIKAFSSRKRLGPQTSPQYSMTGCARNENMDIFIDISEQYSFSYKSEICDILNHDTIANRAL
jgi:hypothetical protein